MSTSQDDLAVLVPAPAIFRVGGQEIRIAPLPVKRLVGLIKFVEQNKDLLDKLNDVLQVGIVTTLETEFYPRVNALLRLVVSPASGHAFLTDEWCSDNLTNAHYRAMFMTVLRQNELEQVFLKAKAFLGIYVENALRQAQMQKLEAETAPTASAS